MVKPLAWIMQSSQSHPMECNLWMCDCIYNRHTYPKITFSGTSLTKIRNSAWFSGTQQSKLLLLWKILVSHDSLCSKLWYPDVFFPQHCAYSLSRHQIWLKSQCSKLGKMCRSHLSCQWRWKALSQYILFWTYENTSACWGWCYRRSIQSFSRACLPH